MKVIAHTSTGLTVRNGGAFVTALCDGDAHRVDRQERGEGVRTWRERFEITDREGHE